MAPSDQKLRSSADRKESCTRAGTWDSGTSWRISGPRRPSTTPWSSSTVRCCWVTDSLIGGTWIEAYTAQAPPVTSRTNAISVLATSRQDGSQCRTPDFPRRG